MNITGKYFSFSPKNKKASDEKSSEASDIMVALRARNDIDFR